MQRASTTAHALYKYAEQNVNFDLSAYFALIQNVETAVWDLTTYWGVDS